MCEISDLEEENERLEEKLCSIQEEMDEVKKKIDSYKPPNIVSLGGSVSYTSFGKASHNGINTWSNSNSNP